MGLSKLTGWCRTGNQLGGKSFAILMLAVWLLAGTANSYADGATPLVTTCTLVNNSVSLSLSATSGPAPASVSATATPVAGRATNCQAYVLTNVQIVVNGAVKATLTSSPYTYTLSNLSPGTYSVVATANFNNGSVSSAAKTFTATLVAPTVTLSGPANGASYNGPANIAMSATAAGGSYSVSGVSFYNGSALLGAGTLSGSIWSFTATGVMPGSYAINAKVTTTGSTTATSATNTVTVNTLLPRISLTAPVGGSVFDTPANVTMSANVTAGTYPVSTVQYYNGATLLGSGVSPSWFYTAANLAAGSYSISAKATDSKGNVVATSTNTISVVTLPSISVTAPADGATVLPSTSLSLTS